MSYSRSAERASAGTTANAEGENPPLAAPLAPPRSFFGRVVVFLEMIKVGHTLFALPFALGATFLAAGGIPEAGMLGKIVLAVLFARTAAMAFNRYIDRTIDSENPRTRDRAIPAGHLSAGFVLATVVVTAAAFIAISAWIGTLALALSPLALVVLLGYSLTKRFTALCHFALGAALALAPVGAWVAIRGRLDLEPWILGLAVLLWTAGFDILYSTLDREFDEKRGLHSLPVSVGVKSALRTAAFLHLGMVGALVWLTVALDLGGVFRWTLAAVAVVLVHEHRLVRPTDLTRVNRAFFLWNAVISVALCAAMIAEGLLSGGGTG